MVKPVLLSNETHNDVKIITDRSAEYGDGVHVVPVLATEISGLALDYPVCFIKDPETGQFQLNVLLGFDAGENLYLDDAGWSSTYIPVHIRRQPFLVGFAASNENEAASSAMISLDMDSRRISKDRGEALFNVDGSKTPFLEGIEQLLGDVLRGDEASRFFIKTLAEADLIEPVKLEVEFEDHQKKTYEGVYTISDVKLSGLKGTLLENLNANGMLQICHQMIGSMGHVRKLVRWKNSKLEQAA